MYQSKLMPGEYGICGQLLVKSYQVVLLSWFHMFLDNEFKLNK